MKNNTVAIMLIALLLTGAVSADPLVQGVLQDLATRHTLADANVFFTRSGAGTTSDSRGRFSLPASPLSPDTLVISYMGYATLHIPNSDLKAGINYFELTRTVLILNELRVESERYAEETIALSLEPGAQRMNLQDIRTVPWTLQPDINNALQFLPGVITMNELTNELNVRGGNPDQNLVLLEGIPVYYPFHLFGLASAFNTDMVGEAHFSPGGFSARYGNRLSSVLDIKAHSPQKPLEVSANLSLLSADLTTSGRVGNKLEWIFSGRQSYADKVFANLGDGVPYTYHDLFAKIAWTPHPKQTLSLMGFYFKDRYTKTDRNPHLLIPDPVQPAIDPVKYYSGSRSNFYWLNALAGVKWDFRCANLLAFSAQVYSSMAGTIFESKGFLELPKNYPEQYEPQIQHLKNDFNSDPMAISNDLTDHSLQTRMDWQMSPAWKLTTGTQLSHFRPDYGWDYRQFLPTPLFEYQDQVGVFFDKAPSVFDYRKPVHMSSGYAETLWQPQIPLTLRAGIRLTNWQGNHKVYAEPRLNARYMLNDRWAVTGAWGYYTQGLATALEDGLVGFLRLYFPLSDSLRPESAQHYIASLDYESGDTRFSCTTSYKRYRNLVRSVGSGPDFIQLPGTALGLELFLKTSLWGWKNWYAVTLSRTFRTINGVKTDTNWDQRYRLDAYLSRPIGKGWKIAGSFVLYSGVPYYAEQYLSATRSLHSGEINAGYPQDQFDTFYMNVPPGRIRNPWYHRLDVSVEKEFHYDNWLLGFYFSVRNLYARRNVLFYEEYGSVACDTRNGRFVDFYIKHPYESLPPIPTIGLRIVF